MNLSNLIRPIAIASIAATCACSKGDAGSEYPQPGASQGDEAYPAEPGAMDSSTGKPSDGQILGILATIDTGEIQQAQIALNKATDPSVKGFASHMVEAHTDAKQKGSAFAAEHKLTAATSPTSEELKNKSITEVESLNQASGATFDTTYMKAQLQQHEEALNLIRTQLMTAARDQGLSVELRNTEKMVQSHIQEAQQILAKLATGAQTQPTQLGPMNSPTPTPQSVK